MVHDSEIRILSVQGAKRVRRVDYTHWLMVRQNVIKALRYRHFPIRLTNNNNDSTSLHVHFVFKFTVKVEGAESFRQTTKMKLRRRSKLRVGIWKDMGEHHRNTNSKVLWWQQCGSPLGIYHVWIASFTDLSPFSVNLETAAILPAIPYRHQGPNCNKEGEQQHFDVLLHEFLLL